MTRQKVAGYDRNPDFWYGRFADGGGQAAVDHQILVPVGIDSFPNDHNRMVGTDDYGLVFDL